MVLYNILKFQTHTIYRAVCTANSEIYIDGIGMLMECIGDLDTKN